MQSRLILRSRSGQGLDFVGTSLGRRNVNGFLTMCEGLGMGYAGMCGRYVFVGVAEVGRDCFVQCTKPYTQLIHQKMYCAVMQ